MNRTRKCFLFALTILLLLGTSSAYAQKIQSAALTPSAATVEQGGALSVTLNYNCTDGGNAVTEVTGFGIQIYYDSNLFAYTGIEFIYDDTLVFALNKTPSPKDDTEDKGGFGASGKFIEVAFVKLFQPNGFPNVDVPLDLFKLNFTAQSVDGATSFKAIASQTPSGYTFEGTDAAVTVGTATPTYDVTFNVVGNGYLDTDGNAGPVVHTVDQGADCPTVTAIPMTDNEFVNWTLSDGSEYATTEAITVTNVQAAATYTANFQPIVQQFYTLTLTPTPGGWGEINATPTPASGNDYAAGTTVTLTTTEATGYDFSLWGGDIDSATPTASEIQVVMDRNRTVTATFIEEVVTGCVACIDNKPATIQVGQSFDWSANCSTPANLTSWSWEFFLDGQVAGTQGGVTSPKTFHNTGAGEVRLTVYGPDCLGGSETVTHTFQVSDVDCSAASAKISGPTTGSVGQEVSFDGSASTPGAGNTIDSYVWDMDFDGTNWDDDGMGTTGMAWTYNTAGTYVVALSISDDKGCEAQTTHTIVISSTQYKPGDYDEDGEVDIFDALGVAMHAAGMEGSVITDPDHLDALDVNEDGDVDIHDAVAIARFDVDLDCECVLN